MFKLRLPIQAFLAGFLLFSVGGFGQTTRIGYTGGQQSVGQAALRQRMGDIMANSAATAPRKNIYLKRELEIPGRDQRPQDPAASFDRQIAPGQTRNVSSGTALSTSVSSNTAQTIGLTFDGVSGPSQTGAFPPDSMGAVGPSQFIIFVNGRIRSFNKTTGIADGVMDFDPDFFFGSLMTPTNVNFTSDPQIRYDRLSGRWILVIIDVPSTSSRSIGDEPNRVLIAVSDGSVITENTNWSMYFIQQDMVGLATSSGEVLDYESLGVDNNALYIGGNMFNAASGSFNGTSVFVVRKSSILNGGSIVVTAFRGLISDDGPDSPRGVDNYDPAANEGYIIGPSDATLGRLVMRRISDPGGNPSISSNIAITVSATALPLNVSATGTTGQLDALDDRLFAAHIRNGRLWTAHNIAVDANGIALGGDRDAARWYELSVPVGSGTPTVIQSGTIFDSAAAFPQWYWIPSVVVSGQGHAAFGFSTAGTSYRINAATTGRLVNDTLGTVNAPTLFTSSGSSYSPSDGSPHRWGDYSFTSVDPDDDMTMWTIQEFCDGTNSYGVEVAKLVAPPPATPASANSSVNTGLTSTSVTITGASTSGSGFFDPGSGFAKHISATVTGGVTVNSVTYIDSTKVSLDLNTTAASAGTQSVTITNPDGQTATGNDILTVNAGSPTPTPSATVTPTPAATPTPTPTATPTPTPIPTVDTPTFSPGGGTFRKRVTFQIFCATPGATIYYTTDGTTPNSGSNLYQGAFRLTFSTTVKAIAIEAGYNDSAVASATFTKSRRR